MLDDEVRRVICPDKVTTDQWLEVHDTAHRLGLRSNNTIMFATVDGPVSWARHLLRVREQQRASGGFTEFVPLLFVHMEAPMYLKGLLAAARRSVSSCSCMPWEAGAPSMDHEHPGLVGQGRAGRRCGGAAGGVNDLGGTLMNESISARPAPSSARRCRPSGWRR